MDNLKPLKLNNGQKGIVQYLLLGFLALVVVLVILGLFWWNKPGNSPTVVNLVLGRESLLEEEGGRVNILLLGIAGGRHDGPNLTDTIIVASYNTKTAGVDLISLPRDLWLEEHRAKVNTLYQSGINKGRGLDFAREEIGKILGIKIPYALRLDFDGFTRAVDLLEGIDVNVEKTFDDYFYPVPGKEKELCNFREEEKEINEEESKALGVAAGRLKVLLDQEGKVAASAAKPGEGIVYTDDQVFKLFSCRFEHLSFKQGITLMDGETALKFVRSRHGTNNEGTDFARSKRQQLVLQAFRDRVLSAQTLFDTTKILDLMKTLDESIETNIGAKQYLELGKLARKQKGVESYIIDSRGKDPLLITPQPGEYGAWVLIPPNNDFSKIQKYVADIFSGNLEASGSGKQR